MTSRITSESLGWMQRAQKVMPGGVNSPVRSFKSVGGNPFVAVRGEGAYLYDVDGNRYIDLVCSWGALIHGHAHPRIQGAISEVLSKGTSFGITSTKEVELCEHLTQTYRGFEMVRLVNSGTEACMSAIRLARGATKRDLILKFDGHYHGHADSFLSSAGSGVATLKIAGSAGVPEKTSQNTIVVSFNDTKAVQDLFKRTGSQIACVILEVVTGNVGVILPEIDFLMAIRNLSEQYGAILIFDEVMTGYRLSLSGASGIYGILPDLVCLGKIIGGGMPLGAYGGKKRWMENVAPLGPVYQAGTLAGNPIASAAGLESLKLITENEVQCYQTLDSRASELKSYLEAHIRLKKYPACVVQAGSMFSIFFRPKPPRNYAEVKNSDVERFNKFFWSLMDQGVYYAPSAFEACFLSLAHTEDIMNEVSRACSKALDEAFS